MQVADMETQVDKRRRCAAQMHTQLQLRAETMAVLARRHALGAVTKLQSCWVYDRSLALSASTWQSAVHAAGARQHGVFELPTCQDSLVRGAWGSSIWRVCSLAASATSIAAASRLFCMAYLPGQSCQGCLGFQHLACLFSSGFSDLQGCGIESLDRWHIGSCWSRRYWNALLDLKAQLSGRRLTACMHAADAGAGGCRSAGARSSGARGGQPAESSISAGILQQTIDTST